MSVIKRAQIHVSCHSHGKAEWLSNWAVVAVALKLRYAISFDGSYGLGDLVCLDGVKFGELRQCRLESYIYI